MTPDDIQELFSAFGVVAVRRMFGGAGIYAHGTMFALVADGVIYLKADERSTPAFERENLPPFTYATNDGKHGVMSYRRMPDRLSMILMNWRPGRARRSQPRSELACAWERRGAGRKVTGRKGRNKISAAKNYASKTTSAKKSITKRRVSKRRAEK